LKLEGTDEELDQFYMYVSWHGALMHQHQPLPLSDQSSISSWLANHVGEPWANNSPADAASILARNNDLRIAMQTKFVELGIVKSCEIKGIKSHEDKTYETIRSKWVGRSQPPDSLICVPTTDYLGVPRRLPQHFKRSGEFCVVINPDDAKGLSHHGVVTPVATLRWSKFRPGLVARVLTNENQPRGVAAVDQVVRNALGLEPGEYLRLDTAQIGGPSLIDWAIAKVIAKRRYVVCRVQHADLANVEQGLTLLSPLALTLLGIPTGGAITIEGIPGIGGIVPELSIHALPAPSEVIDRREELSGGGLESRFPSSRDALGVFPDLPWIFLDSEQRHQLGIGRHKIVAVRVRASLRDQVYSEFRDALLVLAIAALGVANSAWGKTPVILLPLLAVLLLALVLLRQRLKSRLGASPPISRRSPPKRTGSHGRPDRVDGVTHD
jgi:hypothetical protein